jgi:photosystem II stability/assembly factor-like uncharacterized protein
MRITLLIIAGLITCSCGFSQVIPTLTYERLNAFDKRNEARDTSWFGQLHTENIGPTVFSGRVTDIAVNPINKWEWYVAYASGGLWYTNNNGVSFTPLFQQEAVMTIGAIAVDWRARTVWVGTGEVNSSRSSYAGVGIYKGQIGLDKWTLMGLKESHHIGRILLHPDNSDRVSVAVMGPLYSRNRAGGLYQTSDGGKTWLHRIPVNDSTGCIDVVMDPHNPDHLYAATWQRGRKAWDFVESGRGSGIFRSTNGGGNWVKLNIEDSGFPHGQHVGRIGLEAIRPDSQLVLYALLDHFLPREKDPAEDEGLTTQSFRGMDKDKFLALDDKELGEFLRKNNFEKRYTARVVKAMVREGDIGPEAMADYLEDANRRLLSSDVYGAELYRSVDSGRTWLKTHEDVLKGLYNSYGYYFGVVRASTADPDRVYIMGVPILRSDDAGATFSNINEPNVHVDHHAMWINPHHPDHLILGTDGGINMSYDGGKNWIKCNSPAVGQFYTVHADMQDPFWVYGGTQDNGVWGGSHDYKEGTRWHNTGKYHFENLMGGDGMQVEVDPREHRYIYTGYQFGNYFRIDRKTGDRKKITPKHKLGERPLRWNWQTPIHLSVHHRDILYMGSNFVHRSMDRGDNFEQISQDLTAGGMIGDVPYGTLTSIHESPLKFGLLYTGSDDGIVHMSHDGGITWRCISDDLPKDLWVSRIQASAHKKSRVYLALNGYRSDHFTAYLFQSDDYGKNWTRIGMNLPIETVNVIKEDPKNEDILYVGTDHQVYVSMDGGKGFMALSNQLPDVPMHDLVAHPRDDKLVIGTHGRSFFIVDIGPLRSFNQEWLEKEVRWLPLDTIRHSGNQGSKWAPYSEPGVQKVKLEVFCNMPGINTFQVVSKNGATLYGEVIDMKKGYNTWDYALEVSETGRKNWYDIQDKKSNDNPPFYKGDDGKYYLEPGTYTLIIRHETGYRDLSFLALKKR